MADAPLSELPEVVEIYVSRLCYFVVHFLCIVLPMESFNDSKHDAQNLRSLRPQKPY